MEKECQTCGKTFECYGTKDKCGCSERVERIPNCKCRFCYFDSNIRNSYYIYKTDDVFQVCFDMDPIEVKKMYILSLITT